MKFNLEKINDYARKISVSVPSEIVSKEIDKFFTNVQRKAKIRGFRPGKAPLNIVKNLYYSQMVGEVSKQLINDGIFS